MPTTKQRQATHALQLVQQARRWAAFTQAHTLPATYAHTKALDAAEFSIRHRTQSLALPTKLHGVRARQAALRDLIDRRVPFGAALFLDAQSRCVRVAYGYRVLGEIADKHADWVRSLIPFGLKVYLLGVTGAARTEGYLGLNAVLGNVGLALDRLHAHGDGSHHEAPEIPTAGVREPAGATPPVPQATTTLDLFDEEERVLVTPIFRIELVKEGDLSTPVLRTPDAAATFLCSFLKGSDRERFVLCLLSTAHQVIGVHEVSKGSLNASIVNVRETFKAPILGNAAAIIVAHPHPSGNLVPSREDIQITKKLVEAGRLLDVQVLDHLIVGFDGQFTSMAERGLL